MSNYNATNTVMKFIVLILELLLDKKTAVLVSFFNNHCFTITVCYKFWISLVSLQLIETIEKTKSILFVEVFTHYSNSW